MAKLKNVKLEQKLLSNKKVRIYPFASIATNPMIAVRACQASCFLSVLIRDERSLRLASLALMSCMIFLKSTSSCSVHGSDFVDKSTFFGSLISPIFFSF